MNRPLALKIFMLLAIPATVFWAIKIGQALTDESHLVAQNISQAYYASAIIFLFLLETAWLLVFVGIWRGNKLAYMVAWFLEFYSMYSNFPLSQWGTLPIAAFWISEVIAEMLLLLSSWRYFFQK